MTTDSFKKLVGPVFYIRSSFCVTWLRCWHKRQ